jgi:hypothetical protein
VGNTSHYMAVRPDRDPDPVRRFECFTADLHRLADWLQQCGVTTKKRATSGVTLVATSVSSPYMDSSRLSSAWLMTICSSCRVRSYIRPVIGGARPPSQHG